MKQNMQYYNKKIGGVPFSTFMLQQLTFDVFQHYVHPLTFFRCETCPLVLPSNSPMINVQDSVIADVTKHWIKVGNLKTFLNHVSNPRITISESQLYVATFHLKVFFASCYGISSAYKYRPIKVLLYTWLWKCSWFYNWYSLFHFMVNMVWHVTTKKGRIS